MMNGRIISLVLLMGLVAGGDVHADSPSFPGRFVAPTKSLTPTDWLDLREEWASESPMGLMSTGVTGGEVEITPEIQDLARALQNDPVRIFEYVRNRIDYAPSYGSRNGAGATLLAGRGNDLDIAALVIALLQAANSEWEVRYAGGFVTYTLEFMAAMLGVSESQVAPLLDARGMFPITFGPYVEVWRFWVEVEIGETIYVLDAAFKPYDWHSGIDILQVAGYDRTNLLASALQGASVNALGVRDMNEANIRADLTAYATNLIQHIRTHHESDRVEEVLGGPRIIPQTYTGLPTTLPYAFWIANYVSFTELFDDDYFRVRIEHLGIDKEFKGHELAGKRVSIRYGSNGRPILRVDGQTVEEGNATSPVDKYPMTLTVKHVPWFAYTNTVYLLNNSTYVLANDFGAASPALMAKVSAQLAEDRAAGFSESSERVRGGTLHLMALSYFNQWQFQHRMVAAVLNTHAISEFEFGLLSQESGYYIDIPMAVGLNKHESGDTDVERALFQSMNLFGSALEHGMLEQMQGVDNPGASTVKLLQISNDMGRRTFFAHPGNWYGSEGIRTRLIDYASAELDRLDDFIADGAFIVLPRNANIPLGDWNGVGYVAYDQTFSAMLIEGGYKGGYAAYEAPVNSATAQNTVVNAYSPPPPQHVAHVTGADPVDMVTGDFLFEHDDLGLGKSGSEGLHLVRHYNSGLRLSEDLPWHGGWTHSYHVRANPHSFGDPGFGTRQATDAAAMVLYNLIATDLILHETNAVGWVTAALSAKWAMDQLIDNAVTVQLGEKSLQYIRLPDDTWNPPPGVTMDLVGAPGAFEIRDRFDVTYTLNADNRLTQWSDANGKTLTLAYNAQTNLQTVTDHYDRTLTFQYDGSGRLHRVQDSSGRAVEYDFDGDDLLIAFTNPENHTWSYGYNDGRLAEVEDPLGITIVSNVYNDLGRVILQQNVNGDLWDFFVVPRYRSVERAPDNSEMTHYFDPDGRELLFRNELGHERHKHYDGQGRLIEVVDFNGRSTQYQYDANHNLTNIIDALGNETAFTYDSQHRLITVRNALGHETHTEYNAQHNPIKVTDALLNETEMTYTADGLVETVTGPRGETVEYIYDDFGNPEVITRSDGGTETRVYNARGDLLSVTDANTNTTTFTWNKRRLQTSLVDPLGGVASNIYNGVGLLVTNINPRGGVTVQAWTPTYELKSVRFPDGGTLTNTYDFANRLVSVRDPLGNVSSNIYDVAGRLITELTPLGHATHYLHDPVGNVVSIENAAGHVHSNVYDALDRVVVSIDRLGHSVTNEYDEAGRLTAVTDKMGRRTEYEYDALDRLVKQARGEIEHRFEYDASGNRTAYINPKNARLEFGFDLMNRVVAETNAIGEVTQYAYDPVGNLIQKTKPDTETMAYHYDALNRLTNRQSGLIHHQYAYDAAGNLTNIVDELGVTVQTFDAMDRLITVADPFGQTVTNEYNLAGQRTRIVYPGGKTQEFAFDDDHRMTNTIASAHGVSSVSYAFDTVDNLIGITRPNGAASSFTHDALHRVTAYIAGDFIDRTLTRNALGFKTQEQIDAGLEILTRSSSQAHVHNQADQILDVYHNTPGMTVSPYYDANGNLTQVVHTVTIEGIEPPLVFTSSYEYDFDNRLIAVESPLLVAEYKYDGLGHLLEINEAGTIRRLVRDRVSELARPLMETNETGDPTRSWLWANGSLIAQVETGAVRYAHFNELGHLLALTDETGEVTDEFAYHPYGRLVARTGATQTPFVFMGQFGVMAAGHDLYLTRHRAYNANLMRWLSTDPIGLDGGFNLYAYGDANPVWFIDPLGLETLLQIGYTKASGHAVHQQYHAFVIVTDTGTGDAYISRAGPSADTLSGSASASASSASGGSAWASEGDGRYGGVGFGTLRAQDDYWTEGTAFDRPSQTVAVQTIGTVNAPFDEVVSAMQEFADVTNAGNIPYTPTGQGVVGYNSNAYAFTLLESLGFERPRPVRPAPGWNQGRPSQSLNYGPFR